MSEPLPLQYRTATDMIAPPSRRWAIAVLLFLAAILNYIDRQTLSILAPTIQADLGLDDKAYANVVSLFLVAYTIATLLSGTVIDLVGTRIGMAIFVGWWSIANVLTGFARSFTSLAACRVLLGLGEAGNWPGSAKTVSQWFPAKERGFAIGLYTMGATIGATVAPILITMIVKGAHWQWAFVATGILGLCWVIPWLVLNRNAPFAEATPSAATPQTIDEPPARGRRAVLVLALGVGVLMLARMLTDPVWYFYQFWFAKYLFADRGVSQLGLSITWVIFLAADFGSLLGGLASGLLIKRGAASVPARLWVMLACALVMPLSPLVTSVPALWMSLAIAMVIVFAHLAWLVNMTALIVDVMPKRVLGTAFSIIAAGSAVGGIMMNQRVGQYLAQGQSPAAVSATARPTAPATAPAIETPTKVPAPGSGPTAAATSPAPASAYAGWFFIAAFLHPIAWVVLFCWQRLRRSADSPAAAPLV